MKKVAALFLICLVPLSIGFAQEMGMGNPPPPGPDRGMNDLGLGFIQDMGMRNPPPQGFGRGMGNQDVRKQLEQIKIWQMTKEMNLPTEKAEKFFPLYNRYNDEMKHVTAERRDLIKGLDSAIDNKLSNEDIQKQIHRLVDLDNRLADSHTRFIQSMGQILTPVEVAKYLVFEQKFDREIRDRIRMIMMQRMRGPNR